MAGWGQRWITWLCGRIGPSGDASRPPGPAPVWAGRLLGDGRFLVDAVGESAYQNHLEDLCGPRTFEGVDKVFDAELILEPPAPDNPHPVRIEIAGRPVGRLRPDDARRYRRHLERIRMPAATLTVTARIRGGWSRDGQQARLGVWLDLPR